MAKHDERFPDLEKKRRDDEQKKRQEGQPTRDKSQGGTGPKSDDEGLGGVKQRR